MNILDIKVYYCSLFDYKGQRYGLVSFTGSMNRHIIFNDDHLIYDHDVNTGI